MTKYIYNNIVSDSRVQVTAQSWGGICPKL